MTSNNLASSIALHSRLTPDAVAIVSESAQLTYGELAAQASRLANLLRQSPKWKESESSLPRVAVLASRTIDACVAAIGAAWAGATYIPIGVKLPEDSILAILSQCNCAAIIADEEGARLLSSRVVSACPPLIISPRTSTPLDVMASLAAWRDSYSLESSEYFEPFSIQPQDTAYIIFTSGTTGAPKGVMISAASAKFYLEHICDKLGLNNQDRSLETCELSFDFSVHNRFAAWRAGGSVYLISASRIMNAVKFCQTAKVTVWNSVPSLAGMLRQVKALRPQSLPNLRLTVFGGEPLTRGIVDAWHQAAPNSEIVNLYGPTEATVFCLHKEISYPIPVTANRDFVPIGKPLPGNEAAIFDEFQNELGCERDGELAIAGPQLSQGYINDPTLTGQRFKNVRGKRWYLTGDLARLDNNGEFHCLGRIDNQVKVSGHRVELEAIDSHLRTVTGAEVVGTIAWPIHDEMARGVVGFIGAQSVDAEKVIAELKTKLPIYMVPSRIVALQRMPVNQSGKVDRKALLQICMNE
jgi:D-alanine--poly(phosphoribitol) ligase subunit 1